MTMVVLSYQKARKTGKVTRSLLPDLVLHNNHFFLHQSVQPVDDEINQPVSASNATQLGHRIARLSW